MSILKATDICISFGGVKAVDGVSFSVSPGQILSIIGPNGAGKTTLFNIVSGVYAASRGLLSRDRQGCLRQIDSQHMQPQRGDVEGVLAGPASRIENGASECALARQAHDGGLWCSSLPRRPAIAV